ncbi:MAG TPA: NF038122 family metalloprotease [Pyrinomonadaceae bacterium]|nr:NF038122 family metalloprotease [Pyrinomonadaceae bacterium]
MKFRNGILACLLATLTALAGIVPAFAGAQSGAKPRAFANSSSSSEKNPRFGYGLVVYQDENGDAVCRAADSAELQRILDRRGEKHVIYSGAPTTRTASGKVVNSPLAFATTTDTTQLALLPSAGLHIFLHGTSQLEANQAAKNAFIVAANRWESRISTPINVVIDVDFGTQFFGTDFDDPDIIGATGTAEMVSPLSNVRARLLSNSPTAAEQAVYNALPAGAVPTLLGSNTFNSTSVKMGLPNARALGLAPDITSPASLDIGEGDAGIGFNSAFGFDFNPDNGIDGDKTDFDAVATHEMGHALGFSSESGGPVYASVSMWDLFRFRPGTASVGAFGSASRVMSQGGSQVYFNGQTNTFGTQELGLSTGGPDPNKFPGGDNRQSSHWRDDALIGTSYIGIMDPTISDGVREVMTDNDIKAIDSFGYSIDGAVPHPPAPPAPPTGPPANNDFANAVTLTGATGTTTGDSTGATRQSGEPVFTFSAGGRSVWFNWTAPASGTATFDTEGSAYDTMLGVYTGNSVNALSPVGSNDDVQSGFVNSKVVFPVTGGTTYRIVVDGFVNSAAFGADFGYIQLNWQGPAAPQVTSNIQFSSASYNVAENAGLTPITITRTGDTSTGQSVGFFTDNTGTAALGSDYVSTSQMVTFNPGETSKTVNIQIIDDTQTEVTETVVMQLNNPSTGVTLGSPSTATLFITDDDFAQFNNVQFSASSTTAAEAAGKVTVTVTRSGSDVTHAATVFYRTVNGTASDRADYTAAAGTLRFGANETTKTFDVLLTDDRFSEGAEAFNITLSDASQTTVGTPATFTVNITDNDSVTGASPVRWDSNFDVAFFVKQHYADFLNREADAPGLAFWSNEINSCGTNQACIETKRVNVSGAFFQAIEFQETGYLAYRTYKTAFGDAQGTFRDGNGVQNAILVPVIRLEEFLADTRRLGEGVVVGQGAWQAQLEANKVAYFEEFVSRPRFMNAPVTLTPTELVNALYANAGITPTLDQRQAAIGEFGGATNTADRAARGRALRRVAEDPALNQLERNRAFVTMQFFGYLRRNPNDPQDTDHTGWKFWLDKLNQANGNFVAAEMVKAFLTSDEYRNRFGN